MSEHEDTIQKLKCQIAALEIELVSAVEQRDVARRERDEDMARCGPLSQLWAERDKYADELLALKAQRPPDVGASNALLRAFGHCLAGIVALLAPAGAGLHDKLQALQAQLAEGASLDDFNAQLNAFTAAVLAAKSQQ